MWEDIKKFFKTSFKWIIKIVLGLIGLVLLITLIAHLYDNYQEQVVEEDYLVCTKDFGLLTGVYNKENTYLKFEHTRERRFAKGFYMYPVKKLTFNLDRNDPNVYLDSLFKTENDGLMGQVYVVHRYTGFWPMVGRDKVSGINFNVEPNGVIKSIDIFLNRETLNLSIQDETLKDNYTNLQCEVSDGTRFNDNLRKLQEYEASKNQI